MCYCEPSPSPINPLPGLPGVLGPGFGPSGCWFKVLAFWVSGLGFSLGFTCFKVAGFCGELPLNEGSLSLWTSLLATLGASIGVVLLKHMPNATLAGSYSQRLFLATRL